MTLLVAASCLEFLVFGSDRRLSRAPWQPYEEFNKAGILRCTDARMAYGVASNIAAFGTPVELSSYPPPDSAFNASQWMMMSLLRGSAGDKSLRSTLSGFTDLATEKWRDFSGDKRTEFMFAGFDTIESSEPAEEDGYKVVYGGRIHATVTNISEDHRRAEDAFRIEWGTPNHPYLLLGGVHRAVPERLRNELGDPLFGRDRDEVQRQCVHLIRAAANDPESQHAIGPDCTTILLPCHPEEPSVMAYHPKNNETVFRGVNVADCVKGIAYAEPFVSQDPPDWFSPDNVADDSD